MSMPFMITYYRYRYNHLVARKSDHLWKQFNPIEVLFIDHNLPVETLHNLFGLVTTFQELQNCHQQFLLKIFQMGISYSSYHRNVIRIKKALQRFPSTFVDILGILHISIQLIPMSGLGMGNPKSLHPKGGGPSLLPS